MDSDNNFAAIDRLIEFGMSIAVAQQMVQTMNHAMQNMAAPTFKTTQVDMPRQMEYYALVNDIPQGPFTEVHIRGYINSGDVTKTTMVWRTGMPNWLPAQMVPDVNRLFDLMPPSQPRHQ